MEAPDDAASRRWVLGCGIAWGALLAVLIPLGRLNADEGFYALASAKVWQGRLPYRDFAYSQGPVLPYVLGAAPALLRRGSDLPGPSIRGIRLEDALLAAAAFLVLAGAARRLGGSGSAAIAAVLLALNYQTAYLFVIGKTYALGGFLFLGGLSLLAGERERWPPGRLVGAAALLALAAGTRVSLAAGGAAAAVWGVARLSGEERKLFLGSLVLFHALVFGPFALADSKAFAMNVLGMHMNFREVAGAVWGGRLAAVGEAAALWPVLAGAGLFALLAGARPRARTGPLAGAVFLAFAANFVLPLSAKGDYFAPAIPAACLLAGLALEDLRRRLPEGLGALPAAFLAAAALLAAALSPRAFEAKFDRSGGRPALAEHEVLARFLREAVPPGTRVFTFEGGLAATAGRDVYPGQEFSYFGYFRDGDPGVALRYRLLTRRIAIEILRQQKPAALALDDPVPGEASAMGDVVDRVFTARDLPGDVRKEYYCARYLSEYGPYAHPFRILLRRGAGGAGGLRGGGELGDGIRILGAAFSPNPVVPGGLLRVRYGAAASATPAKPYAVLVRLERERPGGGRPASLGEFRIIPGGGTYPTTEWAPGEMVLEELDLAVPEAIEPGRASVSVGFVEVKDLEKGEFGEILGGRGLSLPCEIEERRGPFSLERIGR